MLVSEDRKHIHDLLHAAGKVAIIAAPERGVDSLAAAIALAGFVTGEGKAVRVVYPAAVDETLKNLASLIEVSQTLGDKQLTISFNFKDSAIEKVNYTTEGSTFKMVLYPVSRNFDLGRINYTFTGPEYDLIVVLGVRNLQELGELYREAEEDFAQAAILNIDTAADNTNFGTINIVEPNYDSLSAMLFAKFSQWGFRPTAMAAEAILLGMRAVEAANPVTTAIPPDHRIGTELPPAAESSAGGQSDDRPSEFRLTQGR